jgi:phospholipid/cholesterol/gamma-HCH transport system substrate-binding protein
MGRMQRIAAALTVLAVMAATLFLLLWLSRPKYVDLRAYSDDASGLAEGSVVRLNGIPVGELDKIELTNERDPKRKVVFRIKVREKYLDEIPQDSLVGVASANLLGGEFLNIVRGSSSRHVQPGGELASLEAIDPQRLMGQMAGELQQIQAIVKRANDLLAGVSSGTGNIGKWSKEGMNSFNALSKEMDRIQADMRNAHGNLSRVDDLSALMQATQERFSEVMTAAQSGPGTMAHLAGMMTELNEGMQELQHVAADLNGEKGPGPRLTQLQQRFDELSARIQGTMDRIAAGQGTAGRLTVNNQFSNELSNTASEFQALARDIRANPRKFLSFRVRLF